jgi:DNA (cytosine-5)-methyltransferase 1
MSLLVENNIPLELNQEVISIQEPTMIGCDIFSGAGGMSLGAEMAGINISFAVENDKYAASTFKKNHKASNVLVDDIRKIDPSNIISIRIIWRASLSRLFIIKYSYKKFKK